VILRVLLVTSEGACGIAEHSAYLAEAVHRADPAIMLQPCAECLDPAYWPYRDPAETRLPEIIHLNYHAALHSRWTPDAIQQWQARGCKVTVTYHDTGVPNSEQCRAIYEVADAFVVHEPCADLSHAIYWRQGVPDWEAPWLYFETRPILGTVGFDFPWKNYPLVREAAAEAGWAVTILGGADQFISRREVVGRLAGCDATVFLYNNCNTGTSGAIRQGIAARKPVIATQYPYGRQFRDLAHNVLGNRVITWIEPSVEQLVDALTRVRIGRCDPGIVALAEQDSWTKLGHKYAELFHKIAAGDRPADAPWLSHRPEDRR
jgi:hypothetical protein